MINKFLYKKNIFFLMIQFYNYIYALIFVIIILFFINYYNIYLNIIMSKAYYFVKNFNWLEIKNLLCYGTKNPEVLTS
jgi:hypothetical protein